jgi:Cu/Ag efflux pump CusA
MNADDIVQGIVLMRRGEQSSPTIARVEKLVRSINNSNILPPGVRIERIYDRKDLIDTTTHTVLHNMVVGILLIVLLQWLFLAICAVLLSSVRRFRSRCSLPSSSWCCAANPPISCRSAPSISA